MFTLIAAACGLALAQPCPNGQCPKAPVTYEWKSPKSDPGRQYLYRNGALIGGWDGKDYRTYDARTGEWSAPTPAPWTEERKGCKCSMKCQCGKECHCNEEKLCNPFCTCYRTALVQAGVVPNFGVDVEKINPTERYHFNGQTIEAGEARRLITGDAKLPGDAQSMRLTIIGSDEQRKQVRDDLKSDSQLKEWEGRLAIRDYAPDHWAVSRSGFYTAGQPTIYVQKPDGEVLHRQDDYEDGPGGLVTALRKADPKYDPRKDVDLRSPTDSKVPPAAPWAIGIIVAAIILLIGGKK